MPIVVILVFLITSRQVPARFYTASSHQIFPSHCSLTVMPFNGKQSELMDKVVK